MYKAAIQDYLRRLTSVIEILDVSSVNNFVALLARARDEGRQIFVMGNGGSAATASHICCDLNKGARVADKKGFKFICLNDNVATVMAYANDVSYDDIFVEQLKNFFNKGDLVIGISGSGNSKNVLKAIEFANSNDGLTVGLSGYNGGKLKQLAQHSVHIDVNDMQLTEDLHLVLNHIVMRVVNI
ncbi:SIS domain-containing protein [Deferribacterales bacterium RsTz2092]|nr:phosphoheptose isomerase [Deferribacterales bacterium]